MFFSSFSFLIITKDPHVARLIPEPPQGIFHRTVIEIALEIQEEPVFPVPALDGAGLNFAHI